MSRESVVGVEAGATQHNGLNGLGQTGKKSGLICLLARFWLV